MIYKADYQQKIQDLLNDKCTYKAIRIDPTQQLLRKNNNLVNDIYKNKSIDFKLKQYLTCTAATAPRLYGLPKIHKEDTPLRPISSSLNVPCFKLAKYVGQTLKNIVSVNFNVKNSFQLKENIKNITVDDEEMLISLDVVSLFTNIPIHLAINTIMKQWSSLEKHTTITKKQFLTILEFCLRENNYFVYDGTFYQQVYGMPMGNPLSPTIADIVLDKIIDDSIIELRNKDICTKYITKYVDDIFAIVKTKDVEEILKIFNRQHTKVQFTLEKEIYNKIAFLDVEIHKSENKLKTNWYTKSVASSRMINFNSNHPWAQKKNTAINFITKVYSLSDPEFIEDNRAKIKKHSLQKRISQRSNRDTNNNSDKENEMQ
ncbi:uncharacterized protein LOC118757092 [Rhagoletis pomonella]|uniref:uncharacterized protein LOC118757092 n=1 Tax=Rhagoletis pomonella TaxID=28610 RepID=UPI00177F9D33|nr:uncharacterized protein LOC118757092 [Rhagoletis pomonella]